MYCRSMRSQMALRYGVTHVSASPHRVEWSRTVAPEGHHSANEKLMRMPSHVLRALRTSMSSTGTWAGTARMTEERHEANGRFANLLYG